MLAVIYLFALSLAGLAVVQRIMPDAPAMVRIAGGFLLGVLVTAWITYAVAFGLSPATDESLMIGILVALTVHGAVLGVWGRSLRLSQFRLAWFEIAFIGLALLFSFWLMDQRLIIARDLSDDPLMVSAETWGDTALHTALSRSFSEGANYPTEYPFFANEPIRYHFGYDFFAGALQKGGMSVLFSFNLPGALGFTAMMMLLFSIGRLLFGPAGAVVAWWRDKGVWAGLIAVALLMTNQSLAFRRYVDGQGGVLDALKPDNWWHHTRYLTIGPYDSNEKIAIFDTLNVFLTQTHLIVGMAVVFFVAFGLLQPLRRGQPLSRGRMTLLGVLFGLTFWLNGVLYFSAGAFFGALLVIFAVAGAWRHAQTATPDRRFGEFGREFLRWSRMSAWFIVPALGLAIPQAIWLNGGGFDNERSISLHFGYLACSAAGTNCQGMNSSGNSEIDPLSLHDLGVFFEYYWLNMGLMLPLLGLAAVIGRRFDKKVLLAVMAIFVWGNMVQLSRDLGGHNHKVINLWEIMAGLFVAYALVEVASFRYGATLGLDRLRASWRLIRGPTAAVKAISTTAVLIGAGFVIAGYFLPWLALGGTSASAYDLTFDGFTDANGTVLLHDRPALALLLALGVIVATDVAASLVYRQEGRRRLRAGLGLAIFGLSVAFAAIINTDLNGASVRPGAYVAIAGGALILAGAVLRPEMRLRFDFDPLRPVALTGCALVFFFLVASGLIDFMTIKNDFKVRVFGDPPQPEAIDWLAGNTPKDSVFLTTWGELYTAPTLAGRGVYLGYEPWASSAGYSVGQRQQDIAAIYSAADKSAACRMLLDRDLDYVMIGPAERTGGRFELNESLFQAQFAAPIYEIGEGERRYTFYDVEASCGEFAAVAAPPG